MFCFFPFRYKAMYTLLLSVSILLVQGCKRDESDFDFEFNGMSVAHFEQYEFDSIQGGWSIVQWDSTYADQIRVTKDPISKITEITLSDVSHLATGNKRVFTFPIQDTLCVYQYDDLSYDSFVFVGSGIKRTQHLKEGDSTNYVLKLIEFNGSE